MAFAPPEKTYCKYRQIYGVHGRVYPVANNNNNNNWPNWPAMHLLLICYGDSWYTWHDVDIMVGTSPASQKTPEKQRRFLF